MCCNIQANIDFSHYMYECKKTYFNMLTTAMSVMINIINYYYN